MSKDKNIPIVLICDDNFVVPTGVTISSIISSKNIDTCYEIYIVCASLTAENEAIFVAFGSDTVSIHIIREDANKFANLHENYIAANCAAPPVALLKFALPDIFINYDKILYLDVDILVRTDLSELYSIELGNNLLAAVMTSSAAYNPVYQCVPDYFNSGVMLLNLAQMRLENTKEALIRTKMECDVKFLMDQHTYNYVCTGRVKLLPVRYNLLAVILDKARDKWSAESLNKLFGTNYKSQEELLKDGAIIHFASKEKPWKDPSVIYAAEWLEEYRRAQALHAVSDFCLNMLNSYREKAFESRINAENIGNKLRNAEQKAKAAENEKKSLEKKLQANRSREFSLKNSISYRTGRAITWFPRKVKGGMLCIKEHGPAYTVKRFFWHVSNFK